MKASAVPTNCTRKTRRMRFKVFNTDSLNSWDEVNFNSIQGVCEHESVATSTSSIIRMTEPAISHLPQAGGDPVLSYKESIQCRKQHQNWFAVPITPPASVSNTAVAVHISSVPTTSLPIVCTEAAVTVPDYGGLRRLQAEAIIIDKRPQTTELRSSKICLRSGVSHSSQHPRAAMLWIGQVVGSKSIDDLITQHLYPGYPILDFENLDFKIASGLRKILQETSRDKSPRQKAKLTQ